MRWLSQSETTYWQLIRQMKQMLDPDAIISPGRYT